MKNKLTAVEYLWRVLLENGFEDLEDVSGFYFQAKEIEKEQIIDGITQYEIRHRNVFSENGILNVVNKAEKYYNETFDKK